MLEGNKRTNNTKAINMFENIKNDLADNYKNDDIVLKNIIDRVTIVALSICHRKNTEDNIRILSPYIEECVKSEYINRGSEGMNSLSEGGTASNFKDSKETMRINIIKDGLRVIF